MMVTVGRTYRTRAVHQLPISFGEPWSFPHEHDYTFYVEAEGGTPTDLLDAWWAEEEPLAADPSTVENIAERMLHAAPTFVTAVTVWEDAARWGKAER
jgi:hypothetical protein